MEPELFSQRSPELQFATGLAVPAAFGLIAGIVLGISEPGYLALALLGIAGGYFAGLEHRAIEEGLIRGTAGGLLFGTFILVGHEFSGEAKAELPEPEILLVVITTVAGALLGALGARRRGRRTPAEPPAPE